MSSSPITDITSKDNALLKRLRHLVQDPTAYREQKQVWLEGENLLLAALDKKLFPQLLVTTPELWATAAWRARLPAEQKVVLLTAPLFTSLSAVQAPSGVAMLMAWESELSIQAGLPTVVLDRLQDPGNVGTILRSSAAFGFRQIIALKGSAALGSAKVLRAAMGAHFSLRMIEAQDETALAQLHLPLLATSSHAAQALHKGNLPYPCAWIFGSEGQGVNETLLKHCDLTLAIEQPGGQESLNVAAAAAICLYTSAMMGSNSPVR